MANPILTFIGGLFKPVSDMYTSHQETKRAKETGKQKIKEAQIDSENTLNLTTAEWEALTVRGQQATWKDEYVTVVMTSPFVAIIVGLIFGDPELVNSGKGAIEIFNGLDGDYSLILQMVVGAAIGVNLKRKLWP